MKKDLVLILHLVGVARSVKFNVVIVSLAH